MRISLHTWDTDLPGLSERLGLKHGVSLLSTRSANSPRGVGYLALGPSLGVGAGVVTNAERAAHFDAINNGASLADAAAV